MVAAGGILGKFKANFRNEELKLKIKKSTEHQKTR
jgi:hypothetical protein